MPTISDVTTGLLVGGSVTRTFTEISDTAGAASTSASLCGARTYSVTNSGSLVSWTTITGPVSGTYTITFAPNVDNLHASSPFTLKVHAVLASYTSITADSVNFSVAVGQYQCSVATTYTAIGTIKASYAYVIGDAALSVTAPTYTTSPYTCAESVTYALKAEDTPGSGIYTTTPPAYVTFNSSTRVMQV
jgi:hypothetical protein